MTTRAFWVLWGHPQDKYELTKRTGLNPVVTFPFNRGPYPSMAESGGDHGDDAIDARATAKDLLVYLGAFSAAELETWSAVWKGAVMILKILLFSLTLLHCPALCLTKKNLVSAWWILAVELATLQFTQKVYCFTLVSFRLVATT